MLRVYVFE